MPPTPPIYVERLSVRARWWVIVIAIALFGSAELFAGFDGRVIAIVVAAVLVPTITLLALTGRTVLRVDYEGLHVGDATMTYDDMEAVEALDAPATRLLLGPQADPAARLFVRGYIREAVVVRPMRSEPVPYWLVSTRHPQQVIAAVEQAARASLGR
jgi:DUF3093 family protein